MDTQNEILTLTKQLYPDGTAYATKNGGFKERLHKALNISIAGAIDDAAAVLNSQLPDNSNFTEEDATVWEKFLGIYRETPVLLSDRIKAIVRKLNYPGVVKPREARAFIEWQLQSAGFDVYVYENRFETLPGVFNALTGEEILGYSATSAVFGGIEYGELEYGSEYTISDVSLAARYLDERLDNLFNINNYRATFIVAGSTITDFATVTASRKREFRKMILSLKPLQTVGILFVKYS
jgi:uncharacterized protein YmfQ (DUF2313 family)